MALVGQEGSQGPVLTMRVRCGWKRQRMMQEGQCKGLSLGSTHHCRSRPGAMDRAAVCLFGCFVSFLSLCRPEMASSARPTITIVDMSQARTGWFGDLDDEALHHLCFPDVDREQQIVCACYQKMQRGWMGLLLDSLPNWVTELVKRHIDWRGRSPRTTPDGLCAREANARGEKQCECRVPGEG